jgi:hypothetical protein
VAPETIRPDRSGKFTLKTKVVIRCIV